MRRRFSRFVLLKNGIGPLSIDPIRIVVLMKLSFYLLRKLYFSFFFGRKMRARAKKIAVLYILSFRSLKFESQKEISKDILKNLNLIV